MSVIPYLRRPKAGRRLEVLTTAMGEHICLLVSTNVRGYTYVSVGEV